MRTVLHHCMVAAKLLPLLLLFACTTPVMHNGPDCILDAQAAYSTAVLRYSSAAVQRCCFSAEKARPSTVGHAQLPEGAHHLRVCHYIPSMGRASISRTRSGSVDKHCCFNNLLVKRACPAASCRWCSLKHNLYTLSMVWKACTGCTRTDLTH